MDHSRRSFLKTSAVVTAGLAAAQGFAHAAGSDTDTSKIVEPINTEISAPGDIPLLEGPARGEVRKGDMIYRPLDGSGANFLKYMFFVGRMILQTSGRQDHGPHFRSGDCFPVSGLRLN